MRDYAMVQERQEKIVTMYSKQEKALDVLKVYLCYRPSIIVHHYSDIGQVGGPTHQVRQQYRAGSGEGTPPLQQGVDGVYGEVLAALC